MIDNKTAIKISINFFIFLFETKILIDEPKPAHVTTDNEHISGAVKAQNNIATIKFS